MDAKRDQHLAAKNRADEFGYDYKNKLLGSVDETMNNLFNPTLEKFTQFATQLESDNKKLLEDKQHLQIILKQL